MREGEIVLAALSQADREEKYRPNYLNPLIIESNI